MAEQKAITTLNNLIETCRDGEKGFQTAAEKVSDSSVRELFTSAARERAQFAQELQQEVGRLGGSADEGGSVAGAMHRGWIALKDAVAGGDEKAIIAEAERGEDVAVATYRKAMEAGLPPSAESIVRRQYSQVKAVHDQVRDLERQRSHE